MLKINNSNKNLKNYHYIEVALPETLASEGQLFSFGEDEYVAYGKDLAEEFSNATSYSRNKRRTLESHLSVGFDPDTGRMKMRVVLEMPDYGDDAWWRSELDACYRNNPMFHNVIFSETYESLEPDLSFLERSNDFTIKGLPTRR